MVVLRLPDDLSVRMRELIKEGQALELAEQVGGAADGSKADRLYLDLKPAEFGNPDGDKFVFSIEGKDYPALLANLPTPVEVQKTFDQKTFLKSGDVGQMLRVFHTDDELRSAKAKLSQNSSGAHVPEGGNPPPAALDAVMLSGLTPPTLGIVERRYKMTRAKKTPPATEVTELVEEISRGWRVKTFEERDLEYVEHVEEDLVDFEEWMVDQDERPGTGIVVELGAKKDCWDANLKLVLEHPDAFFKKTDVKALVMQQLGMRGGVGGSSLGPQGAAAAAAAAAAASKSASAPVAKTGLAQGESNASLDQLDQQSLDGSANKDQGQAEAEADSDDDNDWMLDDDDDDDENENENENENDEEGDAEEEGENAGGNDDDDDDDAQGGEEEEEDDVGGGVAAGGVAVVTQDQDAGGEEEEEEEDD